VETDSWDDGDEQSRIAGRSSFFSQSQSSGSEGCIFCSESASRYPSNFINYSASAVLVDDESSASSSSSGRLSILSDSTNFIMSSKSKSDKSKKSRKKNTSISSTALNLSPVVEAGEDDDVDNRNNNYYYHRRRLGDDDRGWVQRQSSSSGGGMLLGPLPFSTDSDGTQQQQQQPHSHSPSSTTYAHATTNNDHDSNMMSSTVVVRSLPPSSGMMYCQNIIAEEDTIIQTEERDLDASSGRGRYYNTNSSSSTHNTNSHHNHFPLKNFEEADLLQRAIERRAYLHDRIVAMEAAKSKLDEGGNASSSGQFRMEYHPRGESGESFPTNAILYPTPPLQVVDDDRQQSTITSATIRRGQRQRQSPLHQLEETSVQPETSSRYQSTSMRHPPPTVDTQSPGERTMDDPSDYNQKNRHLPFDEDGDDSSGGGDGEGMETLDTNIPRRRMSDHRHHHQRMTEISERIKKEALEFMSYESSYAEQREKLAQQLEGVRRSKYLDGGSEHNSMNGSSASVDEVGSDHEDDENDFNDQISSSPIGSRSRSSRNQGLANELPMAGQQQQQRSSPSKVDSAATIDSSAWSGSGKNPTPQQLSRYSNMVRLGIPDVAVIRSMERDGMSNSQSILESLKEEHGIPLSSSSATDIMSESSSSVDMPYVRQSSLVSKSSSSNDITSPEEGGDGKEDGKQVATPLRDDPHYR
jgi:hypothetical protein